VWAGGGLEACVFKRAMGDGRWRGIFEGRVETLPMRQWQRWMGAGAGRGYGCPQTSVLE
jgi:hypothetical protein